MMEPALKPHEKLDADRKARAMREATLDEEPSVKPHEKGDAEREPLLTGHRTHDELLEKGRFERGIHTYGHGIPIFPQAMIYVVILAAIAVLLFTLVWSG
jgi:hypothetical protein